MDDLAQKRYQSVLKRNYEYYLDLYLFKRFIDSTGDPNFSIVDFVTFFNKPIDSKLLDDYYESYAKKNDDKVVDRYVWEIDEFMTNWYKDRKIYKVYYDEFIKNQKQLSQKQFLQIYGEKNNERKCHYCGINEDIIKHMIENKIIKTKRLLTRGWTMEIDRIKPNEGYNESNIVLCCYWCNNAKSDEYSYDEFKYYIAPKIHEIWVNRLNHNKLELLK